jgi:hypothetical protein
LPPPDIRAIVDKTASFVGKHGAGTISQAAVGACYRSGLRPHAWLELAATQIACFPRCRWWLGLAWRLELHAHCHTPPAHSPTHRPRV